MVYKSSVKDRARSAKWARDNRPRHRASIKARRRKLLAATRWYRQEHGCIDCGMDDVRTLQFDHVPGRGTKLFHIATAASNGQSLPALWREIQKCDVVCANCHSVRTYDRRE